MAQQILNNGEAALSFRNKLNANFTELYGSSLVGLLDPSADRILFWDDSNSTYGYLTAGTGLEISGTTIAVSSVLAATTASFTTADESKLDGIEASADVTDAINVEAAGALMDSEVTNLAQVKAFNSADYATAAQGALADTALQPADAYTNADAIDSVGSILDSSFNYNAGIPLITLSSAVSLSLALADTALQPADLYTDTDAIDAVGLILDSSFSYNAGIPLITLSSAVSLSLALADTAVQPAELSAYVTSANYVDAVGIDAANWINELGLGNAALQETSAFATSAQGALAATAVQPAAIANFVESDPTGITGADVVTNIVSLTQSEYDAIGSPNASTFYIITDVV